MAISRSFSRIALPGGSNELIHPLRRPFRVAFGSIFRQEGTNMDIREERYLDYIAMLLISILLLGLTLFELAVVLSRNIHG